MALKTFNNIWTEVLVRNNRSTTDSFITDSMLQGWLSDAHTWAAAYHKWPFTEGRISTTFTTGTGEGSDEWNFEGYKSDSIRIMTIGGNRLVKLNYDDYRILKEERPDANDRVFSDFGRTVYINSKADVSGTLWAYMQYQPYIDTTEDAATVAGGGGVTIFSDWDEEGNEALVEKMSCFLKRREHLENEAELHDKRAANKLEEVYQRALDEQYAYQTSPTREGWMRRFDVIQGGYSDEINRDQF